MKEKDTIQIENLEVVYYTAQFILPGYIISQIVAAIMPQKRFSESVQILHAIGYSITNLTIWYWLFMLINQSCAGKPICCWVLNVLSLIITSCVTGLIIGVIRKKNIFVWIARKLKLNPEHPIPTAWDYKFSDGKSYWLEITISDGLVLRGLYSCNSMSSSIEYRDIYLEKLYTKENDQWMEVDRTAGVWINPDEVRYIKFYEYEEVSNGQE